MTRFADDLSAELSVLVRARVPMHGIRLTVRERIVERLGRGPLGAREVSESGTVVALGIAGATMRDVER